MPIRRYGRGGAVMTVTPRVKTLVIDGQDVSARETETILEAAQDQGIFIPTLCHLDGLSEVGACRLCLVELAASPRLVPACSTRAAEGMVVRTATPKLAEYRKMILELFVSERNPVCSACVATTACSIPAL